MTGTDDERRAALRIGGWLPPANPAGDLADEVAAPASIPATSAPVPDDGRPQPAAPAPHSGPVPVPRRTPGADPAPRVPGGPGTGRRWPAPGEPSAPLPRSRRIALAVAATAAAAAGVPLTIGMIAWPAQPDRAVQPPPALLPTAPDTTPTVGTPTSAAASSTPSVAGSATATPGATRSAADSVTTAPGAARPTSPAPSSPPPPARVEISLEAEGPSAVRAGTASVRSLAGASGGAVVTGIGNDLASLVRFTDVVVSADGTYTVTFHYVGSAEKRRAAITVNGHRVTTVNFPDADEDTVEPVSIRLSLSAGSNTVEFGNRNDWTPDLDRMVVTN